MQVTPIVAIAPLIIIWVKDTHAALLICATLVAFFPVVANAAVGLRSTDLGLVSLFKLYGANRWQTIFLLKLPAALPYYLAGLRIAGGLALIGAVVAEFVAGTGGTGSGLAYRILEACLSPFCIPRLSRGAGDDFGDRNCNLCRPFLHGFHISCCGDGTKVR